jgi:hypothetical protein
MPVPAAAARRAVEIDHDVAQLGAAPGGAAVRPPVEDQAAADAGAEREHDDVARAPCRPCLPLADRGRVRVVVDPDQPVIARNREGSRRSSGRSPITAWPVRWLIRDGSPSRARTRSPREILDHPVHQPRALDETSVSRWSRSTISLVGDDCAESGTADVHA